MGQLTTKRIQTSDVQIGTKIVRRGKVTEVLDFVTEYTDQWGTTHKGGLVRIAYLDENGNRTGENAWRLNAKTVQVLVEN